VQRRPRRRPSLLLAEEPKRVIEEYINDLREVLRKLRRLFN
jgi:hypothetical protein